MRRVTTSSQKVLDKLVRKDRRRAERAGADADLEWLLVNGFEALLEATLEAESDARGLKLGGANAGDSAVFSVSTADAVPDFHFGTSGSHHRQLAICILLMGSAAVHSGMEFKLGEGNSGLRIHGALPKGTNRKCVWDARFVLLGMDSMTVEPMFSGPNNDT